MKLFLVRHGESSPSDDQALTQRGKKETESVATHLKGRIEIDEILHSVKLRAKQTATILGQILAPDVSLIEREGLKPMDSIEPILVEIHSFDRNVMIVGHLPFLERLLTTLLYHKECISPVAFGRSCIVCLDGRGRNWSISRVISPELINCR